MATLSNIELLILFGFKKNPFKPGLFETGDSTRIHRVMEMAVQSNAMVSIVGERGAGKTQAVNSALKSLKVRPVMVRSADKSKLLISDIEQAMIIDLSEEKPKRGREIRARQLRRVLGEASRKQKVVVVIEEGHRLHGMTLRALKTLRELDWMGETELFSIVLLGQSDPMNKAGVAEVRLRSDSVQMHGMSEKEIAGYISSTMGNAFEEKAIEAISGISKAKNFLDLQNILLSLMNLAATDGRKQVTVMDVVELFGKGTKKPKKIGQPSHKLTVAGEDLNIDADKNNESIQSVLNRRKVAV
ncbi:AAA family ATPase [bacterium]|nr:AAA family ATPase [bacterium]